jgi:hypothetical protein
LEFQILFLSYWSVAKKKKEKKRKKKKKVKRALVVSKFFKNTLELTDFAMFTHNIREPTKVTTPKYNSDLSWTFIKAIVKAS